jgi:hypothetical protein
MFTLEQQIFILQCFFSNRERLGPIRHLEFLRNFNKSFQTFKALNQQLAQKVYKCVIVYRCPTTGSPEKKGSLRANILTCILKKKSPISNDNREKTF